MCRERFLAMGTVCFILGVETLAVDKVVTAADRGASASEVPTVTREYKPHEAAPIFQTSVFFSRLLVLERKVEVGVVT